MNKIISYIVEPQKVILYLMNKNYLSFITDKTFLNMKYKLMMGTKLDLKNPKTFNEKLQWLKLYDRNPEYTKMVDKYEAKEYVDSIIGKEFIIPTLGIWDKFEDIDFDKLPNEFVLKPTHTSGDVFICRDKSTINYKRLKKQVNKWLKRNYYLIHREWPYKNIKPRVLIEEYMEDSKQKELIDYKVYAFNGKCDYVMTCFDRQKGDTKFIYYDKNWNMKKEFSNDGIKYGETINLERPKNLDKMFEFASKLSNGIPFVRVDFYEADSKLYFGELTFYPSAGFDNTRTREISQYLNNSLNLEDFINEKDWISNK